MDADFSKKEKNLKYVCKKGVFIVKYLMRCLEMFFAWYNNLDNALTEFFAKVWSYFTWQNFVFIMTGIVMGFVLCMGFYSLIVMYTIKQEAKTKQTVIDPNDGKLNKLVDEIKARYKEESVGMSVKEKRRFWEIRSMIPSILLPENITLIPSIRFMNCRLRKCCNFCIICHRNRFTFFQ